MTDISMPVARADARTRTGEQTRTPPVWEPLVTLPWNAEPLAQLRAVTRLLDELLGDWPGTPAVMADGVSTPLGDLEELDDAWLLRVELPGVKQDDVDIQLTGRRLVVRAERKETERKGLLRRSTRTTGRYFLEAVLPSEVDPDSVAASLEQGVLTIRVPKPAAERRESRRIAVGQPGTDRPAGE
jgi:HSP20 family protein